MHHTHTVLQILEHGYPNHAFMSPDRLATLLLVLLSSKGFNPGRETAARAVAISSMLRMSEKSSQYMLGRSPQMNILLTNEVGLPGLHVQDDETDQASQCRNDTKREGEVDGGFVLCPHSWEKEERECVDYKASLVELIVRMAR